MERMDTSPTFRADFRNQNDAVLGTDAPRGMFVATLLGQESLIYDADRPGLLRMEFDPQLHAGSWHFLVKACVDRRAEDYESIDCDPGYNQVELEFVLCAELEDSALYTECQKTEPEPDDE